ncbi:WecB/TagA/CpsF family glycosyltransferase [Selenihalanaerobacter shriftii]|uniref:N-acetylglucosaminyldiphosphoundecaprenol N-acetyl-beta-D-mannosaminyltransferase n=1 Tax=Selenihalanaerobacter shriftii TaxID=142842 RepID=A0A1T4KK41_9FIRM|nr:WecB/TagA/CpsF family glycosyltransferase [Selenihalanaerobacter shriftii]SJZ42758.1 N-acetylmannosaminyltransferase [Selenihalanaerobacter shriftii]
MAKIKILDILINKVDMVAAIEEVENLIQSDSSQHLVVTPNSEMVVMAQEDKVLKRIINEADLVVPDGVGLVLASKLMGEPLIERVTGIDLMVGLLELAAKRGYGVYFLGAKPGIIPQVKKRILAKYPELKIIGTHHGYLDDKSEKQVIEEINYLNPELLFVGMGVPLQEKWLDKNLDRLKVPISIGVGGSFDVLAGEKKRAPIWIQKLNLEWLYRLIQEPQRIYRILALPKFVYLVITREVLG